MSIYKHCDIRGPYGTELQNHHAVRLGKAIAAIHGKITVAVGGDGRISTPALKNSLIHSLLESGCDVVDLGMLPTPVFYFALNRHAIEAGVMVTASHNPAQDNGFKMIFGPLPITPEEMSQFAEVMENSSQPNPFTTPSPPGELTALDVLPEYIEFAKQFAPSLKGMRVVLDCGNGMAGLTAREIWETTGAELTLLYEKIDGNFPNHPANPAKEKNLKALQKAVLDLDADFGAAFDGDADRVTFVDHLGRPLSNDKAIVLFVKQSLESGPAPIVYDQKCSQIVAETVRSFQGKPVLERSGHTFIKSTFLKEKAPYAGEISGHHFFRQIHGDDGMIASLLMASFIKESHQALAELADQIPTYPITPDIRLEMDSDTARQVIQTLGTSLESEANISTRDGIRAEWPDGWGIVRLSVTEPAITLRFEGKTISALERIIYRFIEIAPILSSPLTAELSEVKAAL